jgi:crotonobetainyl-CoA:carnitine CoA-transferase CaiB-like acyl-CoA transferase
MSAAAAAPRGALDGLRVVDLTQMLAGPFCTMMLADQGAEVIKVEPLDGDGTRQIGPFHPDDELRAFTGYFQSVNRNKLSVGLDLKQPRGREIFFKLIETAQVVVENYRAGVMDRLGLAYETLRERNRRIVYASIRGFGDPRTAESPYLNWPAFDVVAQAIGGIMAITGPDLDTPTKVGPGVGDIGPAIMAAYGIMAAVWRAERTGAGQYVDVGMVDGVLSMCERILHQYSYGGIVPGPEGNRHPFLAPFGLLPARDGFIALACHADEFWKTLCEKLGRPELAREERFLTREARAGNQNAVYAEIGALTQRLTRRELVAMLGGHVPFGPVFDVSDIVADPHFRARDMVVEVDHPGVEEKLAIAGVPVRLSATPGGVRRRAPLLGEQTDEVMHDLGFSLSDTERLRAERVIK